MNNVNNRNNSNTSTQDNNLFEIVFAVNEDNELDMRLDFREDFYMHEELPRNIAILLFAISHGQFADHIKQMFLTQAKNDDYLEFIKEIFVQLEVVAADRIEAVKNNPVISSIEVLKGLPPI